MLQWLILLTLFVHSSLAFGLYDDIDDYHLWRRGGPSVETTASAIDNDCRKDILFLWDVSTSLKKEGVEQVKNFLKELIQTESLNVKKDGTHIAFIKFSNDAKVLLEFGVKTELSDLVGWLDGLTRRDDGLYGTLTHTGQAFELASEHFFSKKSPSNYRGDVDDIILLFTDGNPNPEYEQTRKANKYSKILKTRNVTITGLAAGVPDEVEKFKHNIKKWATSPQLVFEAELGQLDTVISKLVKASCEEIHGGECSCTKENILPFTVYAAPGQQTAKVTWPDPGAINGDGVSCKAGSVDPPGSMSGGRFRLGKHVITYPFSNEARKPKVENCLVEFTVVPCKCSLTSTVEAKVAPGKKTVVVTYQKPEPNCGTTTVAENPERSESLTVGTYTRTYKYSHSSDIGESFEVECNVNIVVTGEFCGDVVYDPTTQVCCCGEIHAKQSGDECCGKKYYNKSQQQCCNDKKAIVRSLGANCP